MIFANGFLFCDDMILLLIDYALIVLTYACGFGLCWLFVFIPTFKTGASQSEELHEFTMIFPARGAWEINNLALFLFDSPQLDCCSPRYGDGERERERERERRERESWFHCRPSNRGQLGGWSLGCWTSIEKGGTTPVWPSLSSLPSEHRI